MLALSLYGSPLGVPAVAAAAGLQAELATIDPGLDLKAIVPAFEALQKKDKELERRLEDVDHLLKDMASRRDFQGRGGAATAIKQASGKKNLMNLNVAAIDLDGTLDAISDDDGRRDYSLDPVVHHKHPRRKIVEETKVFEAGDTMRYPLDLADIEPGNLPLDRVFTKAGMQAARTSAGCENKPDWISRMNAVHDLVAHTYILTLPRKSKVVAAVDTAERLLSVGWPEERLSLFIGADCKAKWGDELNQVARNWHGKQALDLALQAQGRNDTIFSTAPGNTYGVCDLSKPHSHNLTMYGETFTQAKLCFSACCAMSHQLVMMHAFHFKNHVSHATYTRQCPHWPRRHAAQISQARGLRGNDPP